MPYLLFLKKRQNFNCRLLQSIGGSLRVSQIKYFLKFNIRLLLEREKQQNIFIRGLGFVPCEEVFEGRTVHKWAPGAL